MRAHRLNPTDKHCAQLQLRHHDCKSCPYSHRKGLQQLRHNMMQAYKLECKLTQRGQATGSAGRLADADTAAAACWVQQVLTLAMLSTMRALLRLMGVVCCTDRPLSSRGAIMASSGLSTAWTKVVEASLWMHWGTSAGLARQVTSTGMKGLMSLLLSAPQAWLRDLLAAFCGGQRGGQPSALRDAVHADMHGCGRQELHADALAAKASSTAA